MKSEKFYPVLFILIIVNVVLAFPSDTPPVRLDRVSDRLFTISGGKGADGGVYIGDNGILVIDSKMDKGSVESVLMLIGKASDKPLRYLVNTHSDRDHILGNRFFPKGVIFVAHENCRKEFFHPLSDGTSSGWDDPALADFLPSITFRDKMDLYLGGCKAELWYFGTGHTTGDTVVYFPTEKAAFIGDQFFLSRPQLIHSYKGGNSFEHVKTLNRMLDAIDAEYFFSGHSERVDRQKIRDHILSMVKMQEKIRIMIARGWNVEEILKGFGRDHEKLVRSIYGELKK